MVGLTGLEPVTSSLSGKRSNRLSYRPVTGPERGQCLGWSTSDRGGTLPHRGAAGQNGIGRSGRVSALVLREGDLDAPEQGRGHVVEERPESRDRREQHHVDDRHQHREADDPGGAEVVGHVEARGVLAADDVLHGLVDRVPDTGRAEHRPHHQDRDHRDHAERDREQEGGLHDRPRVDPGQPQPGPARRPAPDGRLLGGLPGLRVGVGPVLVGRVAELGGDALPERRPDGGLLGAVSGLAGGGSLDGAFRHQSSLSPVSGAFGSEPGGSASVVSMSVVWEADPSIVASASTLGDSSASSRASTDRATTATASPDFGVTNFTPIVERPVARNWSLIGLRTTWPFWVIESTSSPSSTMKAPTRPPRSALVSDIALMPRPPRDWRRYSEIRVRLANPPSVIVKTYCSFTSGRSPGAVDSPAAWARASAASSASTWAARITDIESSESLSRNFMPETPEVARPIGRSWLSSALNRIAWPLRDTSRMSSSALTSSAPISSSSSSRKLIAMTPAWRGLL